MYKILVLLTETNIISISLRMILAAVCGGIIGYGRERRRQAAGFRTYMIVCVGSALVMLTNIYLGEHYGSTDLARMPAAVLTGLGFLGAGAIIVTRNQTVRGLTTAAGLWATAAMGIALGAGFYLGGMVCFALIFIIMHFMERVDRKIDKTTQFILVYAEMKNRDAVNRVMDYLHEKNIHLVDFEVTNEGDPDSPAKVSAKFSLDLSMAVDRDKVADDISATEGVIHAFKM